MAEKEMKYGRNMAEFTLLPDKEGGTGNSGQDGASNNSLFDSDHLRT